MALQDDMARVLARMHQPVDGAGTGLGRLLRTKAQLDLLQVAKACGAAPEAVTGWEMGQGTPSTRQTVAWLGCLYEALAWRAAPAEAEPVRSG
jgi:transcriptional regulator with XRE-family HTH domain